jgi:moderate conductance mechanosensitive channel
MDWIENNILWILIVSTVLVLIFLFFIDKIRDGIARLFPEKKREEAKGKINTIFWTIEGILAIIMILSFIRMVMAREGTAAIITTDEVKQWFVDHGITIIIMLVVGIALWAALKRFLPSLIKSFMARPVPGESAEGRKRRAHTITGVFMGLGRVIIVLLILLMVLSELGVSVGPILAGFGIVGIAVGFGAQYLIRDLIAGIFILMENQYRIGDVAKIADVAGLVENINLRKTVLRDLDGIVHHIPNGEIRVASNYSRHYSRVNLNISVSYNTDLEYAIEVINRICKEMVAEDKWKKIFKSELKVLRVDNLGDSGIDIKILGDVKPLEQWNAMGELRLRLKKEFDKVGIEIPWPHTKVYFGNAPGEK